MRIMLIWGVFAVSLFVSRFVQAETIWDNGSPHSYNGNEMTRWVQADNFTLTSPTPITDIRFWSIGAYYHGSISWFIYGDDDGAPGELLIDGNATEVTRTLIGSGPVTGSWRYQNDFSVGSVLLEEGDYWLGLHNGRMAYNTRDGYYWSLSNSSNLPSSYNRYTFSDTWSVCNNDKAFQLFSLVPEPSTFVLLGVGVISLFGYVRLRNTKN